MLLLRVCVFLCECAGVDLGILQGGGAGPQEFSYTDKQKKQNLRGEGRPFKSSRQPAIHRRLKSVSSPATFCRILKLFL